MTTTDKRKPAAILKEYFGFLPGTGLKEFAAELRKLSPEEKRYLTDGAARELGIAPELIDYA